MKCPPLPSRLLVAGLLLAPALAAADFPDKPVKFIVAAGPGTTADTLARIYADKLKTQLGQPVVVDNKPGANTAIANDALAKSPADGYTIALTSSALVINPWIAKQSVNWKDLAPVARTGETPYIVTIDAKLPVQNLEQFIAYAKANPGKVSCGTYGVGSPPHLGIELFKKAAGIDILHVPYKTSGQALPELFSGQLNCVFEPPPGSLQHIKTGRLRVIAHTGDAPMPSLPEAEPIGKRFPGASVVGWQGIFAPASTPKPVLDRLRAEWAKVLAAPDVQQKLRDAGFQPSAASIDDIGKAIASDYDKFGKVIKDAGIRLE